MTTQAINTNFLTSLNDIELSDIKDMIESHWGLILVTLIAISFISTRFNHLSDIPGPELAKYTKFWRVYDVFKGQAQWTHIKLHRELIRKGKGEFLRIGPNHVSISDPKAIPTIYGLKRKFEKSMFYPIQCITWNKKPELNLFSMVNEDYHRQQMKLVGNAYAMSSLLEMEHAVDGCTKLMMEKFESKLGKVFDFGLWLQFYAFDVVGEITFNSRLGFLETGDDVDSMISSIRGVLKYSAIIGEIPELHPFLLGNPTLPYIIPSMQTWDKVLQFTLKAVNERTTLKRGGELITNGVNEGNDMLTKWCNNKVDEKMTTRDIIVHLSTNVFAGSDTTAIALRAILYFLMKDPIRLAKARKELDDAKKNGLLSDIIQYKETQEHLPYINACIQEGMRMHPSVGLMLERRVPKGGATISGRFFKEETIVGINAWVLHHDERVFENPDDFIPERWLESSPEQLKKMEKSIFTFGFGSRSCVGKNVSLMEMSKIIPQLLLNYNIEFARPNQEWICSNEWFVQQSGFECVLTRRN
ncbi:hypothetical protein CANARDRAFT_27370 [[Candida] arabinofermentans NRRL YB-2248]|uniref:Cytochrome P450 n=1 Tax=[Candida] arabinofermentans NRRL YB-2248 TaxID=983967 RepID=A0A1E4T5M3_9ASCO|nr:hypothetical protein CANARDRAFT_27370 [[Candida] arabinofermentans NRRL YB-2248]